MTCDHAQSPREERAEATEPFNGGSNVSAISSLSLIGVGATMEIEDAVDTQVVDAFVEHLLVPTLREEEAGASVLHIPACSPEFNPIEERISKIKEFLRAAKARTKRKLLNALRKAIEKVIPSHSTENCCNLTFLIN
jgi:hypothetical protein